MTKSRLVIVLCFALLAVGAAQPPATPPSPVAPPASPPPPVPPPASLPPPVPPPVSRPPAVSAPAAPAAPAGQKPGARPPAPPRPAEAPKPPEAERLQQRGQPVNIKLDVTIVDEGGPHPSRKTVSVTVADRQSGQVRSAVLVPGVGHVPVSLDALPVLEPDGKIRARFTLEYQPRPGNDPKEPSRPVEMRLSFGISLEDGKQVVAAQAADPVTDRRVSVEVTATVLK
jgi:hypothetical protein